MVSNRNNSIGIIGGSFDPVHNGHLAIAQSAHKYFSLNKIYFIPTFIQPYKLGSVSAPAEHRIAMLRLAIEDLDSFFIRNEEIKRGGISYTIDTLNTIKEIHNDTEIYFIIGSDNLRDIPTWRNFRAILSMVTLCVACRPGYSTEIPPSLSGGRIIEFPSPECSVSSTLIRSKLTNNEPCEGMTPPRVLEYIVKNGLYRCS